MGTNKQIRKQIRGFRKVIVKHRKKITLELEKPTPDQNLIRKWRKDIAIFETEINKCLRKLPGGRP